MYCTRMPDPVPPHAPMEIRGSVFIQFQQIHINFLLRGRSRIGSILFFQLESPTQSLPSARTMLSDAPSGDSLHSNGNKGVDSPAFFRDTIYIFFLLSDFERRRSRSFSVLSSARSPDEGWAGSPRFPHPVVPCAPMEIKGFVGSRFHPDGVCQAFPRSARNSPVRLRAMPRSSRETA